MTGKKIKYKNINLERVCFINRSKFIIGNKEISLCNWEEYGKELNKIMCRPKNKEDKCESKENTNPTCLTTYSKISRSGYINKLEYIGTNKLTDYINDKKNIDHKYLDTFFNSLIVEIDLNQSNIKKIKGGSMDIISSNNTNKFLIGGKEEKFIKYPGTLFTLWFFACVASNFILGPVLSIMCFMLWLVCFILWALDGNDIYDIWFIYWLIQFIQFFLRF